MRQSELATTTRREAPSGEVSTNAQLLERAGYVSKLMGGVHSYLPLGTRVLHKIENIVREEMNAIGGQEIWLPALHPREAWDTTQRWDMDVLYRLKGAGDKDVCLGPTHEEVVTPLLGQFISSYKDLPIAVYQIQTKFRNEPRPKSGLLRGREFRMKDLYSFHHNAEDLDRYYEIVKGAYVKIFERVGLGEITYLTVASGGPFSKYSHEFQTITEYGEDHIFLCEKCRLAVNKELIEEQPGCPECNSTDLTEQKAIEVGNIFKLGTRFSDAFGVQYQDEQGDNKPVPMGCYGLGTSRLMGAIVEILHDQNGIIWPQAVSPYDLHLVSLATDADDVAQADSIYTELSSKGFSVLYDDRAKVRAGQKFVDSDLIGISLRVVVSPRTLKQDGVELKWRSAEEAVEKSRADFMADPLN